MQTSLFDAPVIRSKSQAEIDRDRILAQLEKAAGQRFMRDACQAALEALGDRAMTSEALTIAIKARGILPPGGKSDRVFGAVYMTLARRGLIEKAAPSGSVKRALGHGTAGGNLWRRVQ